MVKSVVEVWGGKVRGGGGEKQGSMTIVIVERWISERGRSTIWHYKTESKGQE